MAMQYVPDGKKEEIRRKICEDCKYNNEEEQLACCYCQEGSLFEEREKKKIPRGNRRKTPIIEQEYFGCSQILRKDCDMNCKLCVCRDCVDNYKCNGISPVTGQKCDNF